MNTHLIIVGGGAAGLMAAAAAAEKGIRFMLIERKHRPGRKLLMCGNNRCNLTSDMSVEHMLKVFGPPLDRFLQTALRAFTPHDLQQWFEQHGLPMKIGEDGRVFPASENADDVLHVFTDLLRDRHVPVLFNCPIIAVRRESGGFSVQADAVELQCRKLLLATGGVSYPKTGSVGDGQKIASRLGLKITPFRPGLVGFDLKEEWLQAHADEIVPDVLVTVTGPSGEKETACGPLIPTRWGVRGGALHDASRIIARHTWQKYHLSVDFCPRLSEKDFDSYLQSQASKTIQQVLSHWLPTAGFCRDFLERVDGADARMKTGSLSSDMRLSLRRQLKAMPLGPARPRPLKEAMVTVGGVALDQINADTMEAHKIKGLYFAGEILDIDGPTGGYNLQAAFSTARLAVENAARGEEQRPPPRQENFNKPSGRRRSNKRGNRRRNPRGQRHGPSG